MYKELKPGWSGGWEETGKPPVVTHTTVYILDQTRKILEVFQAWCVSSDSSSLDFQVRIPHEMRAERKFPNSLLHRPRP